MSVLGSILSISPQSFTFCSPYPFYSFLWRWTCLAYILLLPRLPPFSDLIRIFVQAPGYVLVNLFPKHYVWQYGVQRIFSRGLLPIFGTGRLCSLHVCQGQDVSFLITSPSIFVLFFVKAHFDARTTTRDPFLSGIVITLATRLLGVLICSFLGALRDDFVVTQDLVPLSGIGTGEEYSSTASRSMRNIPRMQLMMYVVPSKTFTARFWTIRNLDWGCRSPICTKSGIELWIFMTSFVAVLLSCDVRGLMKHLHWGLYNSH